MAKYVPMLDASQRADGKSIIFKYYETANEERIVIKSYWKVELSNLETIEPQNFDDTVTHVLRVELYTKLNGGAAGDHIWQGTAEAEVCLDMVYDPLVTTQLPDKLNAVRTKIISLLNFHNSSYYEVVAKVTQDSTLSGNTGSNTISGSGAIEI